MQEQAKTRHLVDIDFVMGLVEQGIDISDYVDRIDGFMVSNMNDLEDDLSIFPFQSNE